MSTQDWSRVVRKQRFKGGTDTNTIPIGPIVANYGGEVREGKASSVRCCLHNDSRKSAVINTVDNLYYCHTCGKGGNAVNVVMIIENLEFKDGLKRAVEIATGIGATIRSSNKSRSTGRTKRTWDL